MDRKTMPNQAELQEEVVLGDRDELLLFRVNYSVIELPRILACCLEINRISILKIFHIITGFIINE